ncbi:MAG: tetratricopeptide repeat protein [Treponema sp.]|jgi:tetratricopeptide (TPR) repeat protein|nr:tetratricopeptide repeat protein [Treponema sp.]
MKLDPILARASRFARSGKYEAAMRTLEPEVNRYHGSFNYYYILGSSCLHTGDFGGALTYFRLAHEAKMREPLAILGLAVLYLRRGETQRAVDFYLDVLEIDEKNRTAKKALKVIRSRAGGDSFSNWLETGKLPSLYPPIPFAGFSAKAVALSVSVLLAVCLIASGGLIRFKLVSNPFLSRSSRQGITAFSLTRDERMAPVQTGGTYRYTLTRVQALDIFEKSISLFTAHRDEAARINLNRILESNAPEGLKNRAQIIISYMEVPGFDTFRRGDNAEFQEVTKDPLLYNGVHVIWRGRAANVSTGDSGTSFDFLVGYDTRATVVEGIVRVTFNYAIPLNPERPLELLARIVPGSEEGLFFLEGIAIHQSGNL